MKIGKSFVTRTTGCYTQGEAVIKACRLQYEFELKAESKAYLLDKLSFAVVANKVVEKLQQTLEAQIKKSKQRDYLALIVKYHIPFFGQISITSISGDHLDQFDDWRKKQMGKTPSKSTVLNHNTALTLVFDYAVKQGYMLRTQVPELSNNGEAGKRRAAFTKEEYYKVKNFIAQMTLNSRKEKTRQIRELLLDYIEIAVHSGLRPGTEIDNLNWSDIHIDYDKGLYYVYLTVRKGKTTKYTGTREVVAKSEIAPALKRLTDRFPNRKPDDRLFRLSDGSTTTELSKTFDKALQESNLKLSSNGDRTLYSLRHSYITWELMAQKVSIDVLARQCGTSIQMIEQHYSHVVPRMFGQHLSGQEKTEDWDKTVTDVKKDELIANQLRLWYQNYKRNSCI